MILFAAFVLSGLLGIGISSVLIHVTQWSVIAPHVQEALDKTFGPQKFAAAEGEFENDEGSFYWISSDRSAKCYDTQDGWNCS